LLATLLGTMQAPTVKFVQTLNEVPGQIRAHARAFRDQKEKAAAIASYTDFLTSY